MDEEELEKEINRKNKIYSEVAGKVLSVLSEEQLEHKLHTVGLLGILKMLERRVR